MITKEKAFDTYIEVAKQILLIATGAIVLSVSLISDVFKDNVIHLNYLIISWTAFLATILFAVLFLQAMTGNMDNAKDIKDFDINKWEIRLSSMLMNISFLAGLVFLVTFGFSNLTHSNSFSLQSCLNNEKNIERKNSELISISKDDHKLLSQDFSK